MIDGILNSHCTPFLIINQLIFTSGQAPLYGSDYVNLHQMEVVKVKAHPLIGCLCSFKSRCPLPFIGPN